MRAAWPWPGRRRRLAAGLQPAQARGSERHHAVVLRQPRARAAGQRRRGDLHLDRRPDRQEARPGLSRPRPLPGRAQRRCSSRDDHVPDAGARHLGAGQDLQLHAHGLHPHLPLRGRGRRWRWASTRPAARASASASRARTRACASTRSRKMELLPQTENIFLVYKDGWHSPESSPQNPSLERTWTKKDALVSFKNPKKDVVVYLEADTNYKAFDAPPVLTLAVGGKSGLVVPIDELRGLPEEGPREGRRPGQRGVGGPAPGHEPVVRAQGQGRERARTTASWACWSTTCTWARPTSWARSPRWWTPARCTLPSAPATAASPAQTGPGARGSRPSGRLLAATVVRAVWRAQSDAETSKPPQCVLRGLCAVTASLQASTPLPLISRSSGGSGAPGAGCRTSVHGEAPRGSNSSAAFAVEAEVEPRPEAPFSRRRRAPRRWPCASPPGARPGPGDQHVLQALLDLLRAAAGGAGAWASGAAAIARSFSSSSPDVDAGPRSRTGRTLVLAGVLARRTRPLPSACRPHQRPASGIRSAGGGRGAGGAAGSAAAAASAAAGRRGSGRRERPAAGDAAGAAATRSGCRAAVVGRPFVADLADGQPARWPSASRRRRCRAARPPRSRGGRRGLSASFSRSTGRMLRMSRLLYWKTTGTWSSCSASSARLVLQVAQRLDVGVQRRHLAVGHEDDPVHALQHQLAGGVVEDLAGHRVELQADLHAADHAHVEGQQVEEERAVRLRLQAHHLARATGRRSCGGCHAGSWSSRTGQDRSTRSWPSSASSCS